MFTKESLERLREKIDLIEVISGSIELKRTGSAYKAICPFHQEKSPSFTVQKADTHYHCFGCGAHGDAIQFLMNYLNLSFAEAVDSLAERFHVSLEHEDKQSEPGVNKGSLKEACTIASSYFHGYLLHTEQGSEALHYLYKRGLSYDFIRRFEVGLSPLDEAVFRKMMRAEKLYDETLLEAGLLSSSTKRPFFRDRIMFPIRNVMGSVIGFSARKYKEETFGGKYINSTETPIFKKSRLLFGLNYCRRRITKERRALVVEGQIDCLRLIEAGLNCTVAALGTAFGSEHVEELKKTGVRDVYLLFDGDTAGKTAASKTGDLFQKVGIEVKVVHLPKGSDPDSYLAKFGTVHLIEQLEKAETYLSFQVGYLSQEINRESPTGKAELIKTLKKQIEEWEDPVVVHESLKKIASLVQVPEEMVGMRQNFSPNLFIKNESGPLSLKSIDPNRVLELDLLRWLFLMQEQFFPTAECYLTEEHFVSSGCKQLFTHLMKQKTVDMLSLAGELEDQSLIDEILQKKVNKERAETLFLETVQKLLDREWMQTREKIKMKIHSGNQSEDEVLELAKQFDQLKSKRAIASIVSCNT
ncbi:MAG: DNA primase [Chlamydiales bacterium]|nr:DNA primase [Chlamydiales bacterium]